MDRKYIKGISLLIIVFMLAVSGISAMAADEKVIDEAGVFNKVQKESLEEKVEDFIDEWDMDFVFVVTNLNSNEDIERYAKDYYKSHDYGVGKDDEGLIFVLDLSNRLYRYQTMGEDVEDELEPFLEFIEGEFIEYLRDDMYEVAFVQVLETTDEVLDGKHFKEIDRSLADDLTIIEKVRLNLGIIWFYIIPVVIALVVVVLITISSKGKTTITNRTYETKDSFRVTNRVDQFIRETVSKTKIQKNNSSSGGSGGTSGGGRTGSF